MYALQLVDWGLESEELRLDPAYEPDLSEQVSALLGWSDQKLAHQFLVRPFSEPGNHNDLQDQLRASDLEGLSPLKAARKILMSVHEKLLALEPAYGPQKR